MDIKGRLIAGSHNRNEFVVINADEISRVNSVKELNGRVCEICKDDIEIVSSVSNEEFIACEECAFPVCRPCYQYERREGTQACPRCKTRYKRIKGSPRVDGDEEEEDTDDLENEFVDCRNKISNSLSLDVDRGEIITSRTEQDSDSVESKMPLINNHNLEDGRITPSRRLIMDPKKGMEVYGYGSIAWKDRMDKWWKKQNQKLQPQDEQDHNRESEDHIAGLPKKDEGRQALSRKLPIASSKINPYRMIILVRIAILCLFFHYRILHPNNNAYGLWLTSVICEMWFALSWILDQLPKLSPIERQTYLDRLSFRYEKEGKESELAKVDIFVSTVDPIQEPPLITANTILSVLAVDYPANKVACYVSDDGASMLTFEALTKTTVFAKKWVPFCKKFEVKPRAPELYFSQKADYLTDKVDQDFVRARRAMKREYEEFKVGINGLVATSKKVPTEGWTMQDGTPWPGNNAIDHPCMIQVLHDHHEDNDDTENNFPSLIYVSREKKPSFDHHKKAGAMNFFVKLRVSAIISNAPYVLNIDCDHYVNNSKAIREAMCFMMDGTSGNKISFVQFSQKLDGIVKHESPSYHNDVFFDINMKGLDGIQGPIYVGSGCVFRRKALYGLDGPKKKKVSAKTRNCLQPFWCCLCCGFRNVKDNKAKSDKVKTKIMHSLDDIEATEDDDKQSSMLLPQTKLEKKLGESPAFIASTLLEGGGVQEGASAKLLSEAIHVISCGYEDKTEWGKEVGWIYGSVRTDILTGFKMHCRGWRSVYCIPNTPAFKPYYPHISLASQLRHVFKSAMGSIDMLLSRHCPMWYAYGSSLKSLQRVSYINSVLYPITSIPLLVYCTLPAICLLTANFIVPRVSYYGGIIFMALFFSITITSILEMRWGRVGLHDWWKSQQFWFIGCVSSHFFALLQGLLKVLGGVSTNLAKTTTLKWMYLLVSPMTLLIINMIGIMVGVSYAISHGYDSWGPFFGRLLFSMWVIFHLDLILKAFIVKQERLPTILFSWSLILASILSIWWIRINPFVSKGDVDVFEDCGLDC